MKTERRWMKWVLAQSAKDQPAMPWQRGARRKPAALCAPRTPAKAPRAVAAH